MKGSEGFNEDKYLNFSEEEKMDFHAHEAALVQNALGEAGISPDDYDKTVAFIEDWTQQHHAESVEDFLASRKEN
ncbi:MAG: hypothetical protein JWL80_453 [Parcubacteria group bacterium]|nr:hypothetical protein [Parcubacteria group bacterium]